MSFSAALLALLLTSPDPTFFHAAAPFAPPGAAVPTLRRLLRDETLLPRHVELLDALAASAGPSRLAVLEELLAEDRVYWHNLGLNIDDPAKAAPARLARLHALLRHLDALGYDDPWGHAAAVRDLFATHPIYRQLVLR